MLCVTGDVYQMFPSAPQAAPQGPLTNTSRRRWPADAGAALDITIHNDASATNAIVLLLIERIVCLGDENLN
jgi:hypothetical protein